MNNVVLHLVNNGVERIMQNNIDDLTMLFSYDIHVVTSVFSQYQY